MGYHDGKFADVPDAVWKDLDYEIGRADLDFVDNYRAYRFSDGFLKEEYEAAKLKGCCGFFDTWVTVDGEKWGVGCNHGH